MAVDRRYSGGTFHPIPATVYAPGRTVLASGESFADKANPVQIVVTRIKGPRAMYASERENQGHAQSVSNIVIEVKNEGGGDLLTSDMWIIHRGQRYDIVGVLPSDWRSNTTPYQVTLVNDFRNATG